MRKVVITLAVITAPLAAQQPAAPPAPPDGWIVRLDAKDSSQNAMDTRFQTMGTGYHVTSGPAAIYYSPKDQAMGEFAVRASFGQRVKPTHPEAYGVFAGGSNLDDYSRQQYVYLLVRGDGKFFVAHRAGMEVHKIVDWTENAAVHKEGANGAASNAVAIQVAKDSVHLLVNDARVKSFSKDELKGFHMDGVYGFRVNHGLNVHISNFGITK